MALPQLDTHIFWKPLCAGKTPQKPQLLQRAFSGQGLRSAIDAELLIGGAVPETSGPHLVPVRGGGRPALPCFNSKYSLYIL